VRLRFELLLQRGEVRTDSLPDPVRESVEFDDLGSQLGLVRISPIAITETGA
jgi:hypothetical protein